MQVSLPLVSQRRKKESIARCRGHVTPQSPENRKKECHRFLGHAVILISNVRTSASKKIHGMALSWTLTVSTTAFERRKEYIKFHISRHFFLAWAWRVSMWAWRVDGDRHLFDWMVFTSNVRKIRGSLSGDNVRLVLSQWKTRWYPQSREGDVSTRHVHYPRKGPTIKKFAVTLWFLADWPFLLPSNFLLQLTMVSKNKLQSRVVTYNGLKKPLQSLQNSTGELYSANFFATFVAMALRD